MVFNFMKFMFFRAYRIRVFHSAPTFWMDRNAAPQYERILGATKVNNEVHFLVKLKNREQADVVKGKVAKEMFPHLIIDFYEKRCLWNSSSQ